MTITDIRRFSAHYALYARLTFERFLTNIFWDFSLKNELLFLKVLIPILFYRDNDIDDIFGKYKIKKELVA